MASAKRRKLAAADSVSTLLDSWSRHRIDTAEFVVAMGKRSTPWTEQLAVDVMQSARRRYNQSVTSWNFRCMLQRHGIGNGVDATTTFDDGRVLACITQTTETVLSNVGTATFQECMVVAFRTQVACAIACWFINTIIINGANGGVDDCVAFQDELSTLWCARIGGVALRRMDQRVMLEATSDDDDDVYVVGANNAMLFGGMYNLVTAVSNAVLDIGETSYYLCVHAARMHAETVRRIVRRASTQPLARNLIEALDFDVIALRTSSDMGHRRERTPASFARQWYDDLYRRLFQRRAPSHGIESFEWVAAKNGACVFDRSAVEHVVCYASLSAQRSASYAFYDDAEAPPPAAPNEVLRAVVSVREMDTRYEAFQPSDVTFLYRYYRFLLAAHTAASARAHTVVCMDVRGGGVSLQDDMHVVVVPPAAAGALLAREMCSVRRQNRVLTFVEETSASAAEGREFKMYLTYHTLRAPMIVTAALPSAMSSWALTFRTVARTMHRFVGDGALQQGRASFFGRIIGANECLPMGWRHGGDGAIEPYLVREENDHAPSTQRTLYLHALFGDRQSNASGRVLSGDYDDALYQAWLPLAPPDASAPSRAIWPVTVSEALWSLGLLIVNLLVRTTGDRRLVTTAMWCAAGATECAVRRYIGHAPDAIQRNVYAMMHERRTPTAASWDMSWSDGVAPVASLLSAPDMVDANWQAYHRALQSEMDANHDMEIHMGLRPPRRPDEYAHTLNLDIPTDARGEAFLTPLFVEIQRHGSDFLLHSLAPRFTYVQRGVGGEDRVRYVDGSGIGVLRDFFTRLVEAVVDAGYMRLTAAQYLVPACNGGTGHDHNGHYYVGVLFAFMAMLGSFNRAEGVPPHRLAPWVVAIIDASSSQVSRDTLGFCITPEIAATAMRNRVAWTAAQSSEVEQRYISDAVVRGDDDTSDAIEQFYDTYIDNSVAPSSSCCGSNGWCLMHTVLGFCIERRVARRFFELYPPEVVCHRLGIVHQPSMYTFTAHQLLTRIQCAARKYAPTITTACTDADTLLDDHRVLRCNVCMLRRWVHSVDTATHRRFLRAITASSVLEPGTARYITIDQSPASALVSLPVASTCFKSLRLYRYTDVRQSDIDKMVGRAGASIDEYFAMHMQYLISTTDFLLV